MIEEVDIVIEEPADEIIDITISEVNGDKGQDGITPIKGVDYFDGRTPVKNIDYFDGITPVKGVDYFDGLSVKVNNIPAVAGNIPIATADIPESTDKLYVTQADKNKLTSISGVNTGDETQSSLLNKLGYATDFSGGALSPADHILFSSKQPAGAYLTNTNVDRGDYVYHFQSSGDRVGDWRTYSDANGFYTQYCTVSNATRGNGTWVTKSTISV